jgi:hypothetical protein
MSTVNIPLNVEERDYLLGLLRDELGRLKAEIHRTETPRYKDELRRHEELLLAVIGRLEGMAVR